MSDTKSKYLLLYLNTGGGHISSAKTIANCLNEKYGNKVEPILINGFKEVNKLVKFLIENGYSITQAKAKWLFQSLYALNKIDAQAKGTVKAVSAFVEKYLKKEIKKHDPEKIIIFHFFLTKSVIKILSSLKLKIPVITVVTDPFTAPKIWFTEKKSEYIIFSERAKYESALKMGIPEKQIHIFPFIANKKFEKQKPPSEIKILKKSLGFNHRQKLTVILGGGDGMPHCKKIVKNFIKQKTKTRLAVVCGRNSEQYVKLLEYKKKKNIEYLTVYSFIDFVHELITAADFVITKGGPSSVFEILLLHKIPIINSFIWEQEKGNMEFVRDNKLGFYEPKIKKLPELVDKLISDDELRRGFEQNIDKQNIKNGTEQVTRFIYNFYVKSK